MQPTLRLLGWKSLVVGASAAAALGVLFFYRQQPDSAVGPDPTPGKLHGAPCFEDVTDRVGLNFVHDAGLSPLAPGKRGGRPRYFLPQLMGSGAALFDFNNDGLLDIYLLQNGGPNGAKNRLYRQLPGGRFRDVSAGSGLDIAAYNLGVAVGDVNNDGWPDVVVTQYGGIKLFLNNGDGTFTDVTAASGLKNPGWGCSAAFFDYDRDGWLDLIVVNYFIYNEAVECNNPAGRPEYCDPNKFPGQVARLFHNRGPGTAIRTKTGRRLRVPRFEDVTAAAGLGALPGRGLGVVCADFDGDGWPDILVANDGQANRLWINQRNGTFKDQALERGLAFNRLGTPEANMGIALGDVTGSGRFDVFITHLTDETHAFWRQTSPGLYQDQTPRFGLTRSRWRGTGFGTILGDFHQDGDLDLAVVNGRVTRFRESPLTRSLGPHWSWYAERNQLFANDGGRGFRDVSLDNPAFCGTPNVARGLASGDIDGDGALDLLVTTVAGKARLYRNIAPKRGHWLLVRAVDPKRGGRDAYGAEVRVRAGGRHWLRLINPAGSYLCSSDVRAHFGLGAARRVDEIEVRWPDGQAETEIFPGGRVDRQVVLSRGTGTPASDAPPDHPGRDTAKPR
jgi:hypothetical protein